MTTKMLAILSDALLLGLLLGGTAWLLLLGSAPADWTTDKALLPLSVEGSRWLLLLTAVATALGLVLGLVLPARGDRRTNGDVVRYGLLDRLLHWVMALGYVLAVGTAILLLRWGGLTTDVQSRYTAYWLHFLAAGLIVVSGVLFVVQQRVQGKDRLVPRWADVSPALAHLFGYLGIYGESGVLGLRLPKSWQKPLQGFLAVFGIRPRPEAEDKFMSVQKVLSFTPLAITTMLVVVTGLVKAAKYFFAVPGEALALATTVHDFATYVALVVVGAHVVAIFLVPANWAGMASMFSGKMSLKAIEHEFPAWAARLKRAERPATKEAAAPAARPATH